MLSIQCKVSLKILLKQALNVCYLQKKRISEALFRIILVQHEYKSGTIPASSDLKSGYVPLPAGTKMKLSGVSIIMGPTVNHAFDRRSQTETSTENFDMPIMPCWRQLSRFNPKSRNFLTIEHEKSNMQFKSLDFTDITKMKLFGQENS